MHENCISSRDRCNVTSTLDKLAIRVAFSSSTLVEAIINDDFKPFPVVDSYFCSINTKGLVDSSNSIRKNSRVIEDSKPS